MATKTTTKKQAPKSASKQTALNMDADVYTKEGKVNGTVALPESVFGLPWNADLVHQVLTSLLSNARAGIAHVKDRSEVQGGGKKPWRQKGTGRARHGSRRSPIWVGGGVAHGPRNAKSYAKKINRNVRAKALGVVLSKKYADNEIIFLDSLGLSEPKAKEAGTVLSKLSAIPHAESLSRKRKNAALIALPERDTPVELSLRNFGNVEVKQVKDVSPVDILRYKYFVIAGPDASVKTLAERVTLKQKRIPK